MSMSEHMNRKVLATETSCIRRFSNLALSVEGAIGLTLGEPDFGTPEMICEEAKAALDKGFTHYPRGRGILPLREKIAQFEYKNKGLNYSAEEIIVTNGATEAVASIFKAILNPGDEVIVPMPAFGLYRTLIELYGGKCIPLKTSIENEFQITERELQRSLSPKTKCIVLNYPNNPTGVLLKRKTAKLLCETIKNRSIFVLCDEVYDGLIFDKGEDSVRFATCEGLREKIIIVQSFSKTYAMTGWRVGYVMADLPIANEIFKIHQYTVAGVSHFSQVACIKALDCNVPYMSESYERRTEYVYGRLKNMGMSVRKPKGAFYIFPSIKDFGMSSGEFCDKLVQEQRLMLIPGWCFEGEGHVRISCCYGEEILREAMNRLEAFVNSQNRM